MYFLNIIVLCFLFLQAFGRPTHVLDYDKDLKETSYRDSDSGDSDDYLHSEQKPSLKQFAANEPEAKAELQQESGPGMNEEVDHVRSDKDYLENNDEDEADAAHLSHNEVPMGSDIKRTAEYGNGIILFRGNDKTRNVQTNEYNKDDKVDPRQHFGYLKQYNTNHNINRNAMVRDRRQVKNTYLNEPAATDQISTEKIELNANEDEETAIRRHVKKLSKEELDELLQSLSEDKRSLLRNIIDNCQEGYDSINKREITKKAGANEDNSFVGGEQSDTSKVQAGSVNLEAESSIAPNFEKQDDSKKVDSEPMFSKSPEMASSSEKTNEKINVLDSNTDKKLVKADNIENLVTSDLESKVLGNSDAEKESSKKDSKREIDSKFLVQSKSIIQEPAILRSSNKDDSYCSEDLSQLWNEESSLYNDNKFKREVCLDDLDSIKSLEESFPNVDDSNNFKSGSDMAPLVRVKRNTPGKMVEKRDANVLSDLKVPYFSSALENNEEGSDEGGEFQDDGFFDRGANFVRSGEFVKQGNDISKDTEESNIKYCGNSQATHITKNALQTDKADLGSDTDVVLSGIEGVDDNMMYSGVARIRRSGDAFDNIEGETDKYKQENTQLGSQNEDNEISEEYNNAARYQENDAFGSLPRNYEQDLGRFKRIRRLKPENTVPVVK